MSQKEAVLAARHDLLSRMGSIVADRQPLVQVSPVLTHTHDLTVMCSRHMLKGMCKQGLSSLHYLGIFAMDIQRLCPSDRVVLPIKSSYI